MNEINCMNDFLTRMRLRFPASLKEQGNYNVWAEDCVEYLYSPKVDYQTLYKIAIMENPNENESFVPGVKWLSNQLWRCYKKEAKEEQKLYWRHVKIFNPVYNSVRNTDCFPINTTNEQIIATYKKMFPNTEGWRIENDDSYYSPVDTSAKHKAKIYKFETK